MNMHSSVPEQVERLEFAQRVTGLPRFRKRAVVMAYDCLAMALALWLAFSIRLGEFYWPRDDRVLYLCVGVIASGLAALYLIGVYRVIIRYMDIRAASHLATGAAAASWAWFMLAFVSRIEGLPRSVGFIYLGLLFMLMFFGRLVAAHILVDAPLPMPAHNRRKTDRPVVKGVAICGANSSGSALAETLRRQPELKLKFFVDDNPAMLGRTMLGVPVKPRSELRRAARSGAIEQVLLAMPSSTRTERLALMRSLSGLSVSVMTIPSYEDIMSGRFTFSDIRPVRVEDLLQRDIVPPQNDLIESGVAGKSILVTGAGGSIGSEICRQLLRYGPARMVLLDHSEFALYSIESELRKAAEGSEHLRRPQLVPVIGSLLNEDLVRCVLAQHGVDSVFHAAAYKHVPLLEDNEVIGVRNNVLGTKILADACVAARVPRLTMISTDKAVRPTNVMGSSKRMAELYIQALAHEPGMATKFGIVRFGNVLDSSGSVVQQFRRQIQHGGPVTVTHPDITRFFMSIPEATQLVLQANSLAEGGEVFVLDMGEPVRIIELARTMIALSGMTERNDMHPNGDIEIDYIGLRPGEKLHEELFVGDDIGETLHPQIKMARERALARHEIDPIIHRLSQALRAHDAPLVRALLKEVLEVEHSLAA